MLVTVGYLAGSEAGLQLPLLEGSPGEIETRGERGEEGERDGERGREGRRGGRSGRGRKGLIEERPEGVRGRVRGREGTSRDHNKTFFAGLQTTILTPQLPENTIIMFLIRHTSHTALIKLTTHSDLKPWPAQQTHQAYTSNITYKDNTLGRNNTLWTVPTTHYAYASTTTYGDDHTRGGSLSFAKVPAYNLN